MWQLKKDTVPWLWSWRKGPQAKKCYCKTWEKQGNRFSFRAFRGSLALPASCIPVNMILERIHESHQVCGHFLQPSPYVISSISLLIISKLFTLVWDPAWFGQCIPLQLDLQLFPALALISSCVLLVLFCLRTFAHTAFCGWSTLPLQHSHPSIYLSWRSLSSPVFPLLFPRVTVFLCSAYHKTWPFYLSVSLIFFCLFDCNVGFMEAKTPDFFFARYCIPSPDHSADT